MHLSIVQMSESQQEVLPGTEHLTSVPTPVQMPTQADGKPAHHKQPWTDDQEAWLQRRLDEGADYATVARELGRTRSACFQRAFLKHMVPGVPACIGCGKAIVQPDVGPRRDYCNDACRYRTLHPLVRHTCARPGCQGRFWAREQSTRRYCSHDCSTALDYERFKAAVAAQPSATRGRKLTEEEAALAVSMHEAGVSLKGICRRTGFGFRQTRTALVKAGRVLVPPTQAPAPATVSA